MTIWETLEKEIRSVLLAPSDHTGCFELWPVQAKDLQKCQILRISHVGMIGYRYRILEGSRSLLSIMPPEKQKMVYLTSFSIVLILWLSEALLSSFKLLSGTQVF